MDCNMPGMSGFKTTRLIIDLCKKQNAKAPYIVALTANADVKELRDKCFESGYNKFIQKPISS